MNPRVRPACAVALAAVLALGAWAHPQDTHIEQLRAPVRARLEAAVASDPQLGTTLQGEGFRPFELAPGDAFLVMPAWRPPFLVRLERGTARLVPEPQVEALATLRIAPASGPDATGRLVIRLELGLEFKAPWPMPGTAMHVLGPRDLPAVTEGPGWRLERMQRDGVYALAPGPGFRGRVSLVMERRLSTEEPGPHDLGGSLLVPLGPGSRTRSRIELIPPAGVGSRDQRLVWHGGNTRPLETDPDSPLPSIGLSWFRPAVGPWTGTLREIARDLWTDLAASLPGLGLGPLPELEIAEAVPGTGTDGSWRPGRLLLFLDPRGTRDESVVALAHGLAHAALACPHAGPRPDDLEEALATAVAASALARRDRRTGETSGRSLEKTVALAVRGARPEDLPLCRGTPGELPHTRDGLSAGILLRDVPADPRRTLGMLRLADTVALPILVEAWKSTLPPRQVAGRTTLARFLEALAPHPEAVRLGPLLGASPDPELAGREASALLGELDDAGVAPVRSDPARPGPTQPK